MRSVSAHPNDKCQRTICSMHCQGSFHEELTSEVLLASVPETQGHCSRAFSKNNPTTRNPCSFPYLGCGEGLKVTNKQQLQQNDGMLTILTLVMASCVHTYTKTQQSVYFKCVSFSGCQFYQNNVKGGAGPDTTKKRLTMPKYC